MFLSRISFHLPSQVPQHPPSHKSSYRTVCLKDSHQPTRTIPSLFIKTTFFLDQLINAIITVAPASMCHIPRKVLASQRAGGGTDPPTPLWRTHSSADRLLYSACSTPSRAVKLAFP